MKSAKKILFVVNDADFFLSHRLPIARAARDRGYQVHVAAPPQLGDIPRIEAEGLHFHPIALRRGRAHLLHEGATLVSLFRLYRTLRPDLVHHVTIKPVLYGSLVSRLARVPAVVNAVSGLGYVFIAEGVKASVVRLGVKGLYRLAFGGRGQCVIFQNPDDHALFRKNRLLAQARPVMIRGSGVDMALFAPRPESTGVPVVLLASRLLYDKGVGEFVEAASRLKEQGVAARFVLVGDNNSDNPATIATAQLEAWRDSGVVEWWGPRSDMPEVFAAAHVVALPSYREGLPKVLIEAAAAGRAIVSTDVPGCREIVRHGDNGLLVPARDASSLAEALRTLIEDDALRRRMGESGRAMAVAEFSVEKVVAETLGVYRGLLG